MSDKFLVNIFKEGFKGRYDGKKLIKNLANLGGSKGTNLFVNRNGEYNGIIIELQDRVYPLYTDQSVHSIYLNIETNYTNNILLIEKFGLEMLYQKYSNEIFRFIVDQFLISNNNKPIYLNYPKISLDIKKSELIELTKKINTDIHTLIPIPVKVISCGELLPEEWIGKIFKSGEDFHKSIDNLEARINKPPVTYLANYCMEYVNEKKLFEIKDLNLEDIILKNNLWIQDVNTGKFIKKTNKIDKVIKNYIEIEILDKKIYVFYSKENTFEQNNIELSSGSVGFNVSLMQKSFRRGPEVFDNLKEAINKLSKTKPYNNPEHQYELMSGSRQLFWRYFISIIEDIQIYKSEKYLDIFDLVIYSYIYGSYPKFITSKFLSNKLIELGKRLLQIKSYIDFNKYKEDTTGQINFDCRYQIALKISNDLMPGMKGDKKMIRNLITFIKSKPNLLNIDIIDLSDIIPNYLYKEIGYYAGLDLHTNPQMIVQFQNSVFTNLKENFTDLETCSSLIWNYSSSYNFRKVNKFKWITINDLIYLIQYIWLNSNYINYNKDQLSYNIDFNNKFWIQEYKLKNNLQTLTHNSIFYKYVYDKLIYKEIKLKNMITSNQICQIILSSQFKNNFWYKGKKTYPIYTNDQIKFKYLDEIISLDNDNYQHIFNAYIKYLKTFQTNISGQQFKFDYENGSIIINGFKCIYIDKEFKVEYSDETFNLIQNEKVYYTELNKNNILYGLIEGSIECKTDELNNFINHKVLMCLQAKNNLLIKSDLIKKIPDTIKEIILSRVLTSLEDKLERTTLILASINRTGKHSGDTVDPQYEGYLTRLFNIFAILYGCFQRVNEFKYIIDTKSKIFRYWLEDMGYNLDIKNEQQFGKVYKIIKTKLWEHQIKVRDLVINGIKNYGQRGFGDASEVGSGKTLTALSCIEMLNMISPGSNYLVLVPNTNLYDVWTSEIKHHCENVICKIQESDGKWTTIQTNFDIKSDKSNINPTIWISTMGRNRDHKLSNQINFVIIDECLSVQNKESKWTIKAFEQVVRARFGVLMLSATFFRTRFDKLFFMLKMLCTGLPTKSEYLDTILNTAIGANIKTNRIEWDFNIHKINPGNKFYLEYEKNKISDKFESYIKLKKFLNYNTKPEEIFKEKINLLLGKGRKILVYVESDNQLEIFKSYSQINNLNWGFYPDITKDTCIISKHKGTYGINNLIKYDTILMKPPEPDKLPQIKGRLDRPGQKANKLYIEYIILENTIEEIDLVKIELTNNFYQGHIVPLANYYDKFC